MDGPPDWDLLAVVRSCTSTTTTTTTTTAPPPPPPSPPPPSIIPHQEQLYFSPTPSTCSSSSSIFTFSSPLQTTSFSGRCQQEFQSLSSSLLVSQHRQQQHQLVRRVVRPSQVIFGASSPSVTTSQSQRTRKRKNLMKKVLHVSAEGLSSDMWAWRKYGQKPIKGSPHPRGYYRCSSSKGCLARKQVERNRSDPKMFIVTYTSEHNHPIPTHRNSLAGSTRQKPQTSTGTPPEQPTCSSPSATSLSPLTEKSESKTKGENLIKDEEEDNDMEGLSELMLNDDFYVGFEKIDGGSDDSDCFSEQFSPSSEFPWLIGGGGGTSTATAASWN